MNRVFIRDDDANFFTSPETLETVYGPPLAAGIPVNFAAIPNVSTEAVIPDTSPAVTENFIPSKMAGAQGDYFLDENTELVTWFHHRELAHVVLHGWRHSLDSERAEFAIDDRHSIREKLTSGQRVYRRTFGRDASVFVAPYDRYSTETLLELQRSFRVFSTGWFSRTLLPYKAWPSLITSRIRRQPHCRIGSLQLMSHPGCLISPAVSERDSFDRLKRFLRSGHDLVLVLHHWELWNADGSNPDLLDRFHEILELINSARTYRFASFEELTL